MLNHHVVIAFLLLMAVCFCGATVNLILTENVTSGLPW